MARPTVLSFQAQTSRALPLEVKRLEGRNPQFDCAPHAHRFYELLFVTKGRGWHRVGLEAGRVGPGHLLLVAPGEVHDTRGLTQLSGWLVLFEPAAVDRAERRFVDLPGELAFLPFVRGGRAPASVRVKPGTERDWNRRLFELHRELSRDEVGRDAVARAALEILLIHAARLVAPSLGLGAAHRPLLAEVFQFIDERFSRPISLVDVARAVRRSPAHLTTVVRHATGRSVLQWITERRMAEARRLLHETELEVAEIGERVGFPEPSYFVRRFRGTHHVTPLAFRRAAQLATQSKESTILPKPRTF